MAEANGEIRGVLPEIAIRSGDFEFLAIAAGENLDFRSDRTLVIGEAFEIEAEPVILISAFVTQQDSMSVILRDEDIGGTIVVVVTHDDSARILEQNLVEADVGRDIFESIGTQIAKEADFAFAVCGFADGNEIDPTVVVVVDGGEAVGADPVGGRERNLIEGLALVVAP